ncbi:Methyltransferase [Brachybacterium faecium]|uniref:Methylase involved in ubiquinone/menaquinone biosynthesis n=1 Tax=Brachybacterium faecium (strain ATCC 43885 / DSM 4810 / JCM 11609 / LMG 19847 / NBRC 14762 / NCIMB 9860 / 6-10) TaxID=446465 RepID=C7MAT2_BRAFD|nr:methyltransferase domain-containing protein [Brachybacterium faecium]ACU86819.1 methylase involved in ubiquinone/menaquinone biosynthesis [Brachybacterium faecium DSM 4810]SLN00657.1 Methyltransferase [Brachybacterium faecium]HJG50916.1 methyltransferase domain-containing protein [Brachybacterium faecium]
MTDAAEHRPAYTHGYGAAVLKSHRARTAENSAAHLLPHLRPGMELLDVGSGAGTITAGLARLVGPAHVTALEVSEEAAALTRAELGRQGLGEVEVVVGDAHHLPFADGSVDVVHAHQVLQHVPGPVRALAEFRRVTRPGGTVAVRDSDYEGFRWWPERPGIERWLALYLRAARANGGTPDAGRRLLAWAHEAGFTDVEATSSTQLYATAEGRRAWAGTVAGRVTAGALAEQLAREGWADAAEREEIAAQFLAWAEHPDGWFNLLHGEILARA